MFFPTFSLLTHQFSTWVFSIKNAPRIFDVQSFWSQQHLVQPFVSCLWSRQSPQLRWLWVPWIEFQKGPNLRNKNYSNSSFNGFSYLYVDVFLCVFFCETANQSIQASWCLNIPWFYHKILTKYHLLAVKMIQLTSEADKKYWGAIGQVPMVTWFLGVRRFFFGGIRRNPNTWGFRQRTQTTHFRSWWQTSACRVMRKCT